MTACENFTQLPILRSLNRHCVLRNSVYVGDAVCYRSEVIATRRSNSRPGWGMITVRNTGVSQDGEPVISFVSTAFVECRSAGGPEQ